MLNIGFNDAAKSANVSVTHPVGSIARHGSECSG